MHITRKICQFSVTIGILLMEPKIGTLFTLDLKNVHPILVSGYALLFSGQSIWDVWMDKQADGKDS